MKGTEKGWREKKESKGNRRGVERGVEGRGGRKSRGNRRGVERGVERTGEDFGVWCVVPPTHSFRHCEFLQLHGFLGLAETVLHHE